jgi:hypothetical protein
MLLSCFFPLLPPKKLVTYFCTSNAYCNDYNYYNSCEQYRSDLRTALLISGFVSLGFLLVCCVCTERREMRRERGGERGCQSACTIQLLKYTQIGRGVSVFHEFSTIKCTGRGTLFFFFFHSFAYGKQSPRVSYKGMKKNKVPTAHTFPMPFFGASTKKRLSGQEADMPHATCHTPHTAPHTPHHTKPHKHKHTKHTQTQTHLTQTQTHQKNKTHYKRTYIACMNA